MNRYLVILGVWMLSAWGCDPCEDCGEPLVYDPSVKVVFINQDSINKVNVLVAFNDDSITKLTEWKSDLTDSINFLDDSLDALQILIDDGATEYQEAFDRITLFNDSLDVVRDSVTNYTSYVKAENTELKSLITLMNSGKVQLTSVVLLNNGTELIYEDTMATFSLPLLLGTVGEYAQSNYEITIIDTVFNLDFSYITYETVNEARVASVRARDLDILNSDTVHVNCATTECISDETTVTVYF
ncbi:hypothetical protein [Marinoscillum pacificum]|uniref:hypothetical protein n=1 Tax=Marinoscillum pacificum TaxID=392723 RepID=UPI002157C820|nr:hypothetical protein [Marinoscillum pacificum]